MPDSFEKWIQNAERACTKILSADHVPISAFLELMSTFNSLYSCIFINKTVTRRLYEDVIGGIKKTEAGRNRLQCESDHLKELLQEEINGHGGDLSKCKNRDVSVVISVLWLNRVLWFVTTIIQLQLKGNLDENVIRKAYNITLRRYHSWITETSVSAVFTLFSGVELNSLVSINIKNIRMLSRQLTKVHLKVHKIIRDLRVNFDDKL
jgi:hypothetical protein